MKCKTYSIKQDKFEYYYRKVRRKRWIEKHPNTMLINGGSNQLAFIVHREDGPAIIIAGQYTYALDGNILSMEEYWNTQKKSKYAAKILSHILGTK